MVRGITNTISILSENDRWQYTLKGVLNDREPSEVANCCVFCFKNVQILLKCIFLIFCRRNPEVDTVVYSWYNKRHLPQTLVLVDLEDINDPLCYHGSCIGVW